MAQELVTAYEHGVWRSTWSRLPTCASYRRHLPPIGFEIRSDSPFPGLIAFLRDKHMLLIFENCEHVIEPAAALALAILKGTAGVHILATSREPLRVEGEHVHRLSSLETAPASMRLGSGVIPRTWTIVCGC